jgi:hypothetical protein
VGNKTIVIDDTNTRQTVYIYNCSNSVIQIKGKVNGIAMDKCQRTGTRFPQEWWLSRSARPPLEVSLRTDNSPQPKEAQPLSHALTSD